MTNTVGDITEAVTCTRNGVMMLGEPTYGANEGRRKGGIHSEYQSKPVGSSDVAPDIQWNAGADDQRMRHPASGASYRERKYYI
ncbi:Os11g0693300 [Oryza sativa Japonica Group]|uniref:Os11g0693300 protein n=1 Tax=Oryza sativa subsp. japonica TaxID=39947 RepID=A0A0P0Y5G6_ORYSJ|nr:Os11g0693300 [Oryza sativa Japonica Group]